MNINFDLKIVKKGINALNKYYIWRMKSKKRMEDKRWERLFSKSDKIIGKLNDNLLIFHFRDSVLSRLIYNSFEEKEIVFLHNFLKPGDTFIDVGANIGLFSLHAAQIVCNNGSVHSFEPSPSTFERFELNINLNKFNNIIHANNFGLSSSKSYLKMNISLSGYDAWNTFANTNDSKFDTQLKIPVDTLDNYLKTKSIKKDEISLIKIDVEGWEYEVLKGAKDLLICPNSPALLVEFTENNAFAAGTNCYELYDLVKSFGYEWFTYDDKENKLIPEEKRIHYPYNNIIAIKNLDWANARLSGNK